MPRVRVAEDRHGFVLGTTGKPFVPWGFNYDHDDRGRLLEDYWDAEWKAVAEDLREMHKLGANVVRIHLQFGRFMKGPAEPDPNELKGIIHVESAAALPTDFSRRRIAGDQNRSVLGHAAIVRQTKAWRNCTRGTTRFVEE